MGQLVLLYVSLSLSTKSTPSFVFLWSNIISGFPVPLCQQNAQWKAGGAFPGFVIYEIIVAFCWKPNVLALTRRSRNIGGLPFVLAANFRRQRVSSRLIHYVHCLKLSHIVAAPRQMVYCIFRKEQAQSQGFLCRIFLLP